MLVQVRSAAEEYHAEFAAKEATIASLTAEAEAARSHMQSEIDRLRANMEARAPAASESILHTFITARCARPEVN